MARALWLGAVAALALFTVALLLWPAIDVAAARWFYDPAGAGQARFWANEGFPIGWVYHGVQRGSQLYGLALLIMLMLSLVPALDWLRRHRRSLGFLFLALVIGPGLVVHTFKNEWPRPRPRDTQLFQGEYEFRRLGALGGGCSRNCSFPSGHAGFGAYLGAPACIDRRRRYGWLLLGMAGALGVGFVRMAVGGHWLSDVVFSYWIVTASVALTWWIGFGPARDWLMRRLRPSH